MIVKHPGCVVFIVDDDARFRSSIALLLQKHGFCTELYASAEAFLSSPEFAHAGNSCIVLDIQLDGMSGIDLRRQLSRDGHALPVIFVTGNDSDSLRREALQEGCIAYLTKPFRAQAIVDAIDQALA